MGNAIPFHADSHLSQVNDWHRARGLALVKATQLPRIGFLVPGVAVGFIYQTDSSLVLLDGFVANPALPYGQCSRALDEITGALLRAAVELGPRTAVVITALDPVAAHVKRFGFRPDERAHTVLTKEVE